MDLQLGEDVVIEAQQSELNFRVLSQDKSAFAFFVFYREYFHSFAHHDKTPQPSLKCKVSIRAVLSTFRNLKTTVSLRTTSPPATRVPPLIGAT